MKLLDWLLRTNLFPPQKGLEWYPPFRSMSIQVLELSDDWRKIRIRLPFNAHNRNPGGSMFGGCMASLADPIAALACHRLFPAYSVWTRRLAMDFLREGRSDLELRFDFDPETEHQIKEQLERHQRSTPCFEYAYYSANGKLCAKIENHVAIRPRDLKPDSTGALKPPA